MSNNLMKFNSEKSSNVVWSETTVTKDRRDNLNQQRSAIIWFTGLSGSGKTTVANALEHRYINTVFALIC